MREPLDDEQQREVPRFFCVDMQKKDMIGLLLANSLPKRLKEESITNERPQKCSEEMINLTDIKDSKEKFDNRYRLIEKIGGGGFSEVWLAHDTNADIEVALKIYTPKGELDEEGKEDFKREFARLCGLNHSNIIHAIGFGIHKEELPYLVMSVCKNGSAKKLIDNFEEEELWAFIEQVALGLQYLHAHSITHQDIKPDNILINSDEQYLIIDFGISTKTRNTLRKSNKGTVGGGTPWYMSVESFGTESSDIHARDIWAFGATLYEIITGDVPFGQYGGVTQKSQNGKIPQIKNEVSEELKQVVYDCLALDAWNRPDADALVKRAKAHIAGIKSPPPPPYKRAIMALSVLVTVAGCYFASSYIIHESHPIVLGLNVLNRNDSIYLAKIDEAVYLMESERRKENLSSIDETTLCYAAKIYTDACSLDVTDSVKTIGTKKWVTSQQLIDNTYEYLYNKGVEYGEIGAESASRKFSQRSIALSDYVTPSKRKVNNTPDEMTKTMSTDATEWHKSKERDTTSCNEYFNY